MSDAHDMDYTPYVTTRINTFAPTTCQTQIDSWVAMAVIDMHRELLSQFASYDIISQNITAIPAGLLTHLQVCTVARVRRCDLRTNGGEDPEPQDPVEPQPEPAARERREEPRKDKRKRRTPWTGAGSRFDPRRN